MSDFASTTLATARIAPSLTNPRKSFDPQALQELTDSVRKHGVLQPLLVRPWPSSREAEIEGPCDFELVSGERRLRAAVAAGLQSVPVLMRALTDAEAREIQVVENLQRSDLHPLEEAEGYRQLLTSSAGADVARIAERVGRSPKYVYDRLRLLDLIEPARELFRAGTITAGHAILLSRLRPADQERAIKVDEYGRSGGGLFVSENVLFTDDEAEDDGPAVAVKPVSVRELQGWIDKEVRFDPQAQDLPDLFPETAAVVGQAAEEAEKIISITHDYSVSPNAKDGTRIYGPRSWKRADAPEKPCDLSVTGVIVIGPHRGEAFKVCVDKKSCKVHWAAEQKEAAKTATAAAKQGKPSWQIEEEKRAARRLDEEAQQARWKKALPAIYSALAASIKKASVAPTGQLVGLVAAEALVRTDQRLLRKHLSPGKTLDSLMRHLALGVLMAHSNHWGAWKTFPTLAKKLGVDAKKVLAAEAPPVVVVAKCRKCGCTEDKACAGGCAWARKPDLKTGLGLCSACVPAPKAAKKGGKAA